MLGKPNGTGTCLHYKRRLYKYGFKCGFPICEEIGVGKAYMCYGREEKKITIGLLVQKKTMYPGKNVEFYSLQMYIYYTGV